MKNLLKGLWVVPTRGKFRGRVGFIHAVSSDIWNANYGSFNLIVQFGADGPFATLESKSLRRAASDEIPHGAEPDEIPRGVG